jgi:ATP/ADP translocase
MTGAGLWRNLANRLDIRPGESRGVVLSALAAFFMLAYMILAKSLREGIYLTTFDVKTLPYIIASVVALSIPTVTIFTRLLGRYNSRKLLMCLLIGQSVGLLILWIFWNTLTDQRSVIVVVFYIYTALGTLITTSGFWIATGEQFGIRDAKRLYGLIGAGGTAGAMVMGGSLNGLIGVLSLSNLVPGMPVLLLLMLVVVWALPAQRHGIALSSVAGEEKNSKTPVTTTMRIICKNRHLCLISMIILTTVVIATLVDFQFKEIASASFDDNEGLTGFLGAFYGWMGGLALLVQLLISARIIGAVGIARSLSVMPSLILFGAVGFLLWPGMGSILFMRGSDESLRKSLHRQLVELLFVPIPVALRRQTKAFIDSIVDSGGQGLGALIIFLTITLAGFPSQVLTVLVILFAILFLILNRLMGRAYLHTTVSRLTEGEANVEQLVAEADLHERNLLTASFTHVDLSSLVGDLPYTFDDETEPTETLKEPDPITEIRSADTQRALVALVTLCGQGAVRKLSDEEVTAMIRTLARDSLYHQSVDLLSALDSKISASLAQVLLDHDSDFVIRRRIPAVLAKIVSPEAADALLDALGANRFEVRFRAAIALVHRRKRKLAQSPRDWKNIVWSAIRAEVSRDRPIWELQRLLDSVDVLKDEFVSDRVGIRGELSLEHTFRMLTLVCDPSPIRASYHGIILSDENLNSFALEYLEQVLPVDIRQRLWLFIGDVSDHQRERQLRPIGNVVGDLMETRATLFAGEEERNALMRLLREQAPDDR